MPWDPGAPPWTKSKKAIQTTKAMPKCLMSQLSKSSHKWKIWDPRSKTALHKAYQT